tara:strand:+ start:131876 stop:134710 length:2835 start_codon:yes stop_codon:yes gene_type:complete
MVTNNHYDDDALMKLLRDRIGANEDGVFTHVESCATCQSQLETLSKDGLTWEEVAELLTPSGVPLTGFTGHGADEDSGVSPTSNASFLEASEYPASLGRFARYEIMEILGRGGMGIVMRGYDTSLNRHSAVKVLAPELAGNAAARKRFSREARSAAAVVHPHVVPIQTVDEHAGLPYLVMPVVEGRSVDARVQDSGPLQVIEAVRIAAQIADGLAAAHEQGLVHRDIKPANVLLENGVERVHITDFGLARAIDDASMTRSGVITGTPQYMSPEQAHGDAIDHRSDLFSLGSLIYFMLTGRSPFRAETTMGVLNRIGNDQPRSVRSINTDVPEWLERIVAKLLEKQPSSRFQTASEVAELLDRWLAHLQQPALIPPPQPLSSQAKFGKSPRRKWLVVATGAGFIVVAAFLFMMQQDRKPGPSTAAAPAFKAAGGEETKKEAKDKQEDSVAALTGLHSGQKEFWRAALGTMTMRAPVVHDDHVYVGSNNGHGYLERLPASFDLGVLLCFRKSDGKFLWQHSNHKLPTGRVHDWPQLGITSRPCVTGERLFYVTNRGEIVCLDTMGFHDSENDGVLQDEVHTDLNEADVVWRFDMMKELGVQPHNVSTCTIAYSRGRIFAVTGNGVGASHVPPLADAPSFIAVDSRTGELLWQDTSPGQNVLHGQWGSPTVIEVKGEPQVIFPGGDGWLYSFDPEGAENGKSKLNWKFDCNSKESVWKLGADGSRNNLLHGPTLHEGRLYVTMGQDPEHGGGQGRLWCIDPTGTGDVSPQLVYNKRDPETPIAHRRKQACVVADGDFTRPNPNSKVFWQFEQQDVNGNGKIEIEETMSRSLSKIAIKDDLLFVSDIEGILHCLDRITGKQHWGYDTFSNVYSTPVIVGDHVYLGTVDGDVLVFGCSADLKAAAPDGKPHQRIDCGSSVYASVVADGSALYFTTKNELIAVENKGEVE